MQGTGRCDAGRPCGLCAHRAPSDRVPRAMARHDTNPDALDGAADPVVELVGVEGADIYTEVRGSGAPVLIVGAADEDAEIYRGIAERLAITARVATYDRRGTGRSSRDHWPCDSARHADDAAAVIESLDLRRVTVLGASAGGIVALRLALRHPELLGAVLCFEPGLFHVVEGGDDFRAKVQGAVEGHLRAHPRDWTGAANTIGQAAVTSLDDVESLFTPPPGREWFASRTAAQAESLIRGDLRLTAERFDLDEVAACPTTLRFSYGTASLPIFRDIARALAEGRRDLPDALDGVGHGIFHHPDVAAHYVAHWISR